MIHKKGKTRASLEDIKQMKGRSNIVKLIEEQKQEKLKPESQSK